MYFKPLKNHPQSPAWHFSFHNTILNPDYHFVLIIPSVEMRR